MSKVHQLPNLMFTASKTDFDFYLLECEHLWSAKIKHGGILAKTPLTDALWTDIFAYMYRRFGPPDFASDAEGNYFSPGWLLDTPDESIVVEVRPSPTVEPFACWYKGGEGEEDRQLKAEDFTSARIAQMASAYETTLLDLLRPVDVDNDSEEFINVLGEIDPDDEGLGSELTEIDEDTGEYIYRVPFAPTAGLAFPEALISGETWLELCRLVFNLGEGDFAVGKTRAIEILKKNTDA